MANELFRIQPLVAGGEKKAKVTVEAILGNIEECTAGNGSIYLKGQLTDKEDALEMKIWDMTLDGFKKETGIDDIALVQCTGDFEFYNGKPQFIAKTYGNKLAVIKSSNQINDYIDAGKYDGKQLINGFQKIIKEEIKNPLLQNLALKALAFGGQQTEYYPYSSKYHTEKGGLISHLYFAFRMALTNKGYAYEFDKEVILTAILCSRLSVFTRYKVDPLTGKIQEKNEIQAALFCQLDNIFILESLINEVIVEYAREEAGKEPDKEKQREIYHSIVSTRPDYITNVLHCVSSLYGKVSPATPEALMTRQHVHNEIKIFEMMKKKKTLAKGESALIDVFGEHLKVIA